MTNTNVTNALDSVISSGYKSWSHVPYYYNDYNVAGNDPTCKHTAWTDTHASNVKQPYFNRYCDSCGYRKLFIKYAKYCRTTKKGGRK
jgi:hypothetical protein